MARKREFVPEALLESAMWLFWQKGYEGTSLRDIVEHSGVNQFGIYQLYTDKHGLFLAVLDRYRDHIVSSVFGVVEQPEASLEAIHAYFQALVQAHSIIMPALGCLMANTIAEGAERDEEVRQRTRQHIERLRVGLSQALANACRTGELSPDLDIAAMADYLVVTVQGLAVYSRMYPEREPLQRFIDSALSLLTK
jgi:TetR/AcrR family transcriptional regulator, transcriptional repressor for nem operon